MFKPVLALPLTLQIFAVAEGVPNLNVTTSCKGAARAVAPSESSKREKACFESEHQTRDRLKETWTTFPVKDRNFCLGAVRGYAPTYTELATCLEMIRDVRQAGDKPAEEDRTAPGTMPMTPAGPSRSGR
jgi:hypothetical protein